MYEIVYRTIDRMTETYVGRVGALTANKCIIVRKDRPYVKPHRIGIMLSVMDTACDFSSDRLYPTFMKPFVGFLMP